ncbi:hypothetical protein RC083_04015 [Pseudoalteromonas haloplanktis]|uniref:HEAT repeat domain-containing protein n=1 Tax=Pseudoalteromonas haloplanktis TaxID=228 RepID=A0ABU1B960_PSEHA|nr:hypothetical protein [Pseudoalteromonas haloplanktis]MDQ9090757.1 hypothetical protein [Pseudoalteromonas haloplanktis]
MWYRKSLALLVLSLIALIVFYDAIVTSPDNDEHNFNASSEQPLMQVNEHRLAAQRFAYTISLHREGFINSSLFSDKFKSDQKLAINGKLSARLNITLIKTEQHRKLFFGQFSQLSNHNYFSDNDINTRLSPFSFYLNNNGGLELNEENIEYSRQLRELVTVVLPYLQVVGVSNSYSTWQTKEIDPLGRYKSEYVLTQTAIGSQVEKRKLNYDTLNKLPALFDVKSTRVFAQIAEHKAVISINTGSQWPNKTLLSEHILLKTGHEVISSIPMQFSALLTEFDHNIDMPDTLAQLIAISSSNEKKVLDYYETDDALTALVANKNIDGVFQYYDELASKDQFLASDVLVNYLRLHPELSIDFVDAIYKKMNSLTAEQEIKLWHALAKAGHPEAQIAYIYALENPEFTPLVYYRAIGHIRVFQRPTDDFIAKLWSLQSSLIVADNMTQSDRNTLSKGVLFAIATLSTAEHIDSQNKARIIQTIKSRLDFAASDTERLNLLIAVGNTKNSMLLDAVTPFLTSSNSQLQAKAFKALAQMPHNNVIDTYITAYEEIDRTDRKMQYHALKNLNVMDLSDTSIDWVAKRALQLNNKTETKRLIHILGDNSSHNQTARTTLEQLLTMKLSAQLKSEIYAYIPPN